MHFFCICLEFDLFMKFFILNEIYSAFLLYHLFLSCYIFKYVVIIKTGNGVGMEKVPPTENPCPRPCFYLCGDEDGFGGGDRDSKAISSPTPLPSLLGGRVPTSNCLISRNID